ARQPCPTGASSPTLYCPRPRPDHGITEVVPGDWRTTTLADGRWIRDRLATDTRPIPGRTGSQQPLLTPDRLGSGHAAGPGARAAPTTAGTGGRRCGTSPTGP